MKNKSTLDPTKIFQWWTFVANWIRTGVSKFFESFKYKATHETIAHLPGQISRERHSESQFWADLGESASWRKQIRPKNVRNFLARLPELRGFRFPWTIQKCQQLGSRENWGQLKLHHLVFLSIWEMRRVLSSLGEGFTVYSNIP